jgi:hypothetical protein
MRLFTYNEASAALAWLLMLTCGTAAAQEFAGRENCAPIQPSSAGR